MIENGVNLETTVREALKETMGETPSAVLLLWIEDKALKDPRFFALAMEKTFGEGSESIYNSVEKYAELSRLSPAPEQPAEQLIDLTSQPHDPYTTFGLKRSYLHDHRAAEDIDEYVERLAQGRSDGD